MLSQDQQRKGLAYDKGHVAICQVCYVRFGETRELIGKERDVFLTVCERCDEKMLRARERKDE